MIEFKYLRSSIQRQRQAGYGSPDHGAFPLGRIEPCDKKGIKAGNLERSIVDGLDDGGIAEVFQKGIRQSFAGGKINDTNGVVIIGVCQQKNGEIRVLSVFEDS